MSSPGHSHESDVVGAEPNLHTLRALAALVFVTLGGTFGFMLIEGWGFWRALFFTLITITTVGYGDEGISDAGEKFTILILVSGIGVASYTIAAIVQWAVTVPFAWRPRMRSRINKLSDHTIICGFGRMGRTIADQLSEAGADFVVIDPDPGASLAARTLGLAVVEGNATEDEILLQAGVERARHVVAVADSDAENIVIVLSARELQPRLDLIARAERGSDVRKLRRAGADRVISPFHSGGIEIANAILRPRVADILAHAGRAESELALAEISVQAGSTLVGSRLSEYGSQQGKHISFVALERPDEAVRIPPSGSDVLESGDLLIVAGDPMEIVQMQDLAADTAL